MSDYPRIFRVRQNFASPSVENIPATVEAELTRLQLDSRVKPGQTVAITAGSRGIANIAVIIKAVVQHMQRLGLRPFIVPAMGSHGGGTAEGQRGLIEGYGVTEEAMGCPIRASMETVVVCDAAEGFPVHFDRHASQADHVVVVNRIKPHTMFVGDVESGLMKMMLIGLGKHEGAKVYHRVIRNHSFGQIVRSVAREVLSRCRILCGVGIVENAYDQTAKIKAVGSQEFEEREKELLILAKEWLPRLPFKQAHLLLVDEIGKNISGSGMDTNVVGRKFNDHEPRENEWPKIKIIAIRGLTPETHGNASGIGIAEMCRQRVVDEMDREITYVNCETAGHLTAAMIPIPKRTDREIIDRALTSVGMVKPPDAQVMWIRNTLHLAELECSEAYYAEARERRDLTILSEPRPLPFDAAGNLPDYVSGSGKTH
jgi:hypothetical protein